MTPAPGGHVLRYVGDRIRFSLRTADGAPLPEGWRALLRTTLGRARVQSREIIDSYGGTRPQFGASWRDIPLRPRDGEWSLDLPMTDVGYFRAKAYIVDPRGHQVWPAGPDVGICVHPDIYRTGNTVYCAFTRMFGPAKTERQAIDSRRESEWRRRRPDVVRLARRGRNRLGNCMQDEK
jgi:hypothetical protein